MIFDVKMYFTCRARFVANDSGSTYLEQSTYTGVVYRYTARISFTYAALRGLVITAPDIHNTYLQEPTSIKYWMVLGPEFVSELKYKRAYIFPRIIWYQDIHIIIQKPH